MYWVVKPTTCKYRLQELRNGCDSEGANARTSSFGDSNDVAHLIVRTGNGNGNGNNIARTVGVHGSVGRRARTTGKIHGKTSLRSRKGQTSAVGIGGCDTPNQLITNVLVNLKNIRTIAHQGNFPAHDRASFHGFGVTGSGSVTVNGLSSTSRANASKLNPQAVCHGVLLNNAKDLVASVSEVCDTSQAHAPRLGGGDGDHEALLVIIVGQNVFRVGVGLQGSVGQADELDRVHGAVSGLSNGSCAQAEDAGRVGDFLVGGNLGSGIDEVTSTSANATSDASETGIDRSRKEGDQVAVVPEGSRIIGHSLCKEGLLRGSPSHLSGFQSSDNWLIGKDYNLCLNCCAYAVCSCNCLN